MWARIDGIPHVRVPKSRRIGDMRTYLDGEQLPNAGSTLGSALAAARQRAGDRLVIEARIDGRVIPAGELVSPPPADPFGAELHLKTEDATRLLRDSLMFAADAVRELAPRQQRAAELIQSSKTSEAMEHLRHVLECWEKVKQVLELAGALGVEAGGEARNQAVADLGRDLMQIKRHLSAQDWCALADVLAFDLPPLCEQWASMLNELAVACAAPTTGTGRARKLGGTPKTPRTTGKGG